MSAPLTALEITLDGHPLIVGVNADGDIGEIRAVSVNANIFDLLSHEQIRELQGAVDARAAAERAAADGDARVCNVLWAKRCRETV